MASILPFIKKYINSKDKPIDEQIDEFANSIGAQNDGTLIAQGLGTFVLTENEETLTIPEDGVYRIVTVSKGGTVANIGYVTKAINRDYGAGGGTSIIIARLLKGSTIKIEMLDSSGGTEGISVYYILNGKTYTLSINNNAIGKSVGTSIAYTYPDITLSSACYNGKTNGGVGCLIPGLMSRALYNNDDIYYTGTFYYEFCSNEAVGFLDVRTQSAKVQVDTTWIVARGAQGYGTGNTAISKHTYNDEDRCNSQPGPAACIITLLKKE